MRYSAVILLLAACVCMLEAYMYPDPSWAVQVKSSLKRRSKRLGEDDKCSENKIFSCNSCWESKVCKPTTEPNTFVQVATVTCPDERPYCDDNSGSCTDVAGINCGNTTDTFICLEKSQYFPDKDCRQFHYCDESYQARLFTCVGDRVYDATKQTCSLGIECGKFSCDNKDVSKVSHSNYPRYYAMCSTLDNDNEPLVVGVCPPFYQIDDKSQNCKPACNKEGNLPDSTDCKKYISCNYIDLLNDEKFMQVKENTCISGQSFDRNLLMCVPDPDGKLCQQ